MAESKGLAKKYQKKSDREHVLDNPDTYTNDFSNNLPVYKNSSDYYIFYSDISYGWQWRKLSDAVQDNSMNFNIQNPPPYTIKL